MEFFPNGRALLKNIKLTTQFELLSPEITNLSWRKLSFSLLAMINASLIFS